MAPPEIIDAEIKKLDETKFAKHFPAVGQMQVDPTGALWANLGGSPLDSTTTWAIFDPTGALQGRVTLPKGRPLRGGHGSPGDPPRGPGNRPGASRGLGLHAVSRGASDNPHDRSKPRWPAAATGFRGVALVFAS